MSTRSILLIEHEVSLREVLYASLREVGGWKVTLSSSIKDGMDQCLSDPPDAILIDASASETDALIFIEQLKQHSIIHAIPILIMTARANWFNLEQLQQMGFTGVVAKPFNPMTLPDQIAHILGWRDERTVN